MKDSGLQHAMRALLSIIAGLLVAEMLQHLVGTFRKPKIEVADVLTVIAATLFLFRVVVDNILFYELKDRTEKAYWRRIFLIGLDLLSYTALYHMVAELKTEGQGARLPILFIDMIIVESLHALWCVFALNVLHATGPKLNIFPRLFGEVTPQRQRWRWLIASVLGGALAVGAWCLTSRPAFTPWGHAPIAIAYAVLTSLGYAWWMKESYTGTAESWTLSCEPICRHCQEPFEQHEPSIKSLSTPTAQA